MNRTRRTLALAATIAALCPLGTTASAWVWAEGTPMPAAVHILPDGQPMPAHVGPARGDGTPLPAVVRPGRPCTGKGRISRDDGNPIPACW